MIVRFAGQANRMRIPVPDRSVDRSRPDDPRTNPARTAISPDYPVNVKSIEMASEKRAGRGVFRENPQKTAPSSGKALAGCGVEGATGHWPCRECAGRYHGHLGVRVLTFMPFWS